MDVTVESARVDESPCTTEANQRTYGRVAIDLLGIFKDPSIRRWAGHWEPLPLLHSASFAVDIEDVPIQAFGRQLQRHQELGKLCSMGLGNMSAAIKSLLKRSVLFTLTALPCSLTFSGQPAM